MRRLFSKIRLCHLLLGFTYTVNLWDFFREVLSCRAMTEQKTRDAKLRHSGVTM